MDKDTSQEWSLTCTQGLLKLMVSMLSWVFSISTPHCTPWLFLHPTPSMCIAITMGLLNVSTIPHPVYTLAMPFAMIPRICGTTYPVTSIAYDMSTIPPRQGTPKRDGWPQAYVTREMKHWLWFPCILDDTHPYGLPNLCQPPNQSQISSPADPEPMHHPTPTTYTQWCSYIETLFCVPGCQIQMGEPTWPGYPMDPSLISTKVL